MVKIGKKNIMVFYQKNEPSVLIDETTEQYQRAYITVFFKDPESYAVSNTKHLQGSFELVYQRGRDQVTEWRSKTSFYGEEITGINNPDGENLKSITDLFTLMEKKRDTLRSKGLMLDIPDRSCEYLSRIAYLKVIGGTEVRYSREESQLIEVHA